MMGILYSVWLKPLLIFVPILINVLGVWWLWESRAGWKEKAAAAEQAAHVASVSAETEKKRVRVALDARELETTIDNSQDGTVLIDHPLIRAWIDVVWKEKSDGDS